MKLHIPTFPVIAGLAMLATIAVVHAEPAIKMEWTIDGATRQALVIAPGTPGEQAAPVILVFHGHGGTMQSTERLGFQKLWPEAIVVCPQGLATATITDPEGKRAGWQHHRGENNDRDLRFVDAILTTLREQFPIDDTRIYATGHSNGGVFTYLLWTARGETFAALAPSAAVASALRETRNPKPLPILHLAGEKDTLVPMRLQQFTMAAVRRLNGCAAEGQPWATAGPLTGTLHPSRRAAPLVAVLHPGTHRYPAEAPALIVRFFKEHARPTEPTP